MDEQHNYKSELANCWDYDRVGHDEICRPTYMLQTMMQELVFARRGTVQLLRPPTRYAGGPVFGGIM
jgi:hypothetical protein